MRRVAHQFLVSHVLHYGSEVAFSLLFVSLAYVVQAIEAPAEPVPSDLFIATLQAEEKTAQDPEEKLSPDRIEEDDVGTQELRDELVIAIDEKTSDETIQTLVDQSIDIDSVVQIEETQYITIDVPEEQKDAVEELLEERDDVEVSPHYIRRATVIPDDSSYETQWHHENTNAGIHSPSAWNVQTGSSDVVVAIIDSGVDTDHPDLIDNIWVNTDEIAGNGIDDDGNGYVDDREGYDFVENHYDPNPDPDGIDNDGYAGADTSIDHGTHVAGIVGAVGNNATGVAGVSWDVSLMSLRVLDDEGSGTDADIVEGIEYAVDNGADIINLSLGGYGESAMLEDAIGQAANAGVMIFAAAGNDGVSIQLNPFYPACYDGDVLAVSSSGGTGRVSSFSNFANGEDCVVDVAAPGELIYSTMYTNDPTYGFTTDYDFLTGTSMATPVVAGIAALLLSEDSTLDRVSIYNLLQTTARQGDIATKYGAGIVIAQDALDAVSSAHYPSAPTTLSAKTRSANKISFGTTSRSRVQQPIFSWSGAYDIEGVAGYYLYFGKDASADPEIEGVFQTERTYTPTRLKGDGKKWYVRIKTQDTDGHVSEDVFSFTYIIDTVLPRVKNLSLVSTEEGVRLEWGKLAKKQKVQKYVIRRAVAGSKKFRTIARLSKKKEVFVDASVKDGKRYTYRIRAVDDVGNISHSKKRTITFVAQE